MTDPEIDVTRPSSARVWNYLLGGKDNFAVDRQLGEALRTANPGIAEIARAQRRFLIQAVTLIAGEVGIRQFLDIGTGLPTADNTHEVAQRVAPDSRIVYVDNDPLVLTHARALLKSSPEGATAYVDSRVEDPERILAEAARTLDFSRPVALTMIGILGNVADYAEARAIVTRLLAAVPSGSYLVVSDGTSTSEQSVESQRVASRSGHPYNLRSPEEIAGYFEGLEVLAPGVVPTSQWRPAPGSVQAPLDVYCAVGRKP
ncbi:SAM-dependent methyltransferase [Catenuloplanes japonicus]|uniref:SAM-dependent methyltransferase n=1 Tax=Catenuloplanes japonicus TaxID=33876 RepID=UPI000689C479|nr:SAM-dependent methyltransferase [Catenuloplanes japonicus]